MSLIQYDLAFHSLTLKLYELNSQVIKDKN